MWKAQCHTQTHTQKRREGEHRRDRDRESEGEFSVGLIPKRLQKLERWQSKDKGPELHSVLPYEWYGSKCSGSQLLPPGMQTGRKLDGKLNRRELNRVQHGYAGIRSGNFSVVSHSCLLTCSFLVFDSDFSLAHNLDIPQLYTLFLLFLQVSQLSGNAYRAFPNSHSHSDALKLKADHPHSGSTPTWDNWVCIWWQTQPLLPETKPSFWIFLLINDFTITHEPEIYTLAYFMEGTRQKTFKGPEYG